MVIIMNPLQLTIIQYKGRVEWFHGRVSHQLMAACNVLQGTSEKIYIIFKTNTDKMYWCFHALPFISQIHPYQPYVSNYVLVER